MVKDVVDIFYYDLNIYNEHDIKTFSIYDCLDQVSFLKTLNKPIYIGGGINHNNAKLVFVSANPHGLDISRGLKDNKNNISEKKLKILLKILSV